MTPTAQAAAAGGRRFLWWLALGTASLAGLVAGMLALQLRQSENLEDNWQLKADSVTALAFQFEREFLRLRHVVDVAVQTPSPENLDELSLRYNIFLSRKVLLEDNPSTRLIRDRAEYRQLLPRLEEFIAQAEPVFAAPVPKPKQLQVLLAQLNGMGPNVQALSFAATSVMAGLIETKQHTIREQGTTIVRLTIAQLVLLLLAAAALWVRHQRLVRERIALEELTHELREARQKAEAASEGKSRFLANMSHELRTPFNGMLGMLSMLETTALTSQQADYTHTVRESAQHLLTLLNDILDVSAMDAGKLKLKPTVMDLRALLASTEALMQISARDKGLTFTVTHGPSLPHWVQADPTRLKQILFNLLSNGIKFTEKGRVTLSVDLEGSPGTVAPLRITVTDTGIGMTDQAVGRLFQRFYQVESGADRRFGGAGLGLDISRTLARLMGGDLTVSSRPGVGSTFTLTLPLPVCDGPTTLPTPAVRDHGAESAAVTSPSHADNTPVRVLVAEDHPVNRKVMAALLGKLNCDVTFCENGQEAVNAVATQTFDLVFMDIHMPVMDGLAATRLIRQSGVDPQTLPIIALTADVMNEARENAMQAGVNEFLTKPIRLPELQQAMAHWLPSPAKTR
jgi:signal transduction histidine kinase/ActR/RegA family two-component response regulator